MMNLASTRKTEWRLLPVITDDGYRQMSIDHALLRLANKGKSLPVIRFYRWSPPALTIGRFQPVENIDLEACQRLGIDVVRRPTGGRALLHKDDLTYAVIFPNDSEMPPSIQESYLFICRGIIRSLQLVGLETYMANHMERRRMESAACFSQPALADLSCRGLKICGSAQVRKGGALLQHGSIFFKDNHELLFQLFKYPSEKLREARKREYLLRCTNLEREGLDLEWSELANAFIKGFGDAFGAQVTPDEFTREELLEAEKLYSYYKSSSWLLCI